jgi:uncharacterized protein (DUF4415 family)
VIAGGWWENPNSSSNRKTGRLFGMSCVRCRRPPKKLVSVRLDADVFEWLQQYGAGYSTRINNILRVVMAQGL